MRAMALLRIAHSSLAGAGLLAAALAAACGGGDPASPTFTATHALSSGDDASDDASTSSGTPAGDSGTPFASCGTSPATGSIPADVQAVLGARCQTCHQNPPLKGAPFPLLTYADIHSLFDNTIPKYEEMHALIQPAGSPHMPYGDAPQLDAAQFATLDGWLLDCAPPGE
jgi:hypothetical protein